MAQAEERIITGIRDGRIETETSITDRFLQELESVCNTSNKQERVFFRARTLRDRGRNAPEMRYGTDFCAILDVKLKNYVQGKGFLSQAKKEAFWINVRIGPYNFASVNFRQNDEFRRLGEQVDRMLSITPDSFVIVYSQRRFVVVPASSIKGLKDEAEVYGKPVANFFKEYLMCFVGDPKLKAFDDDSLEKLRMETRARTAIMFQIHELGVRD